MTIFASSRELRSLLCSFVPLLLACSTESARRGDPGASGAPGSGDVLVVGDVQAAPTEVQLAVIEENSMRPHLSAIDAIRSMLLVLNAMCTDNDLHRIGNFIVGTRDRLRAAGIEVSIRRIMGDMVALPLQARGGDGTTFHASCAELAAGVEVVTKARYGRLGGH